MLIDLREQLIQLKPKSVRHLSRRSMFAVRDIFIYNYFTIINCDFSAIQSTIGACERYFVSLHEDFKRSVKGVKDKHQVRQRRLRRKKQVLKLL